MSELTTRTRGWFLRAVVLFVLAVAVLHDPARTLFELAALVVFFAAAIRFVGLAVRDHPTRTRILSRNGLLGGVAGGVALDGSGPRSARGAGAPHRRPTTSPRRALTPTLDQGPWSPSWPGATLRP